MQPVLIPCLPISRKEWIHAVLSKDCTCGLIFALVALLALASAAQGSHRDVSSARLLLIVAAPRSLSCTENGSGNQIVATQDFGLRCLWHCYSG